MLTQPQADKLADAWLQAWNSRDLARIMEHYADAIEFRSPFIVKLMDIADGSLHGKPALAAYFAQGLAKFPELHFTLLQVLPGVGSVTLLYRSVNDLLAAEVMEIDAAGKICRVMAHYCDTAAAARGALLES